MGAQENPFEAGLERLKALMSWWGIPSADMKGVGEQQMERFQSFVFDLQKTLTDTSDREVDALFTLNQRIAGLLQKLLLCREPQEIFAILTEVQAAMLAGGMAQAQAWADLTQQMQEQYAALSRAAPGNAAKAASSGHGVAPAHAKPAAKGKVGSAAAE